LKDANVTERFTVHGLRRTFNDLTRRAGVDPVVIKTLTGHVTEKMRTHHSTVGLDEKVVAAASVHRIVSLGSGDAGGDATAEQKKAGEGRAP
jgi:integrase